MLWLSRHMVMLLWENIFTFKNLDAIKCLVVVSGATGLAGRETSLTAQTAEDTSSAIKDDLTIKAEDQD